MEWVLVVALVTVVALLVVGSLTGRVRVRSCCAADPRQDLRMRAAFDDDVSGRG